MPHLVTPNRSEPVISISHSGLMALDQSSDGTVWLMRLHPHSTDWVTVRKATPDDIDVFSRPELLKKYA